MTVTNHLDRHVLGTYHADFPKFMVVRAEPSGFVT